MRLLCLLLFVTACTDPGAPVEERLLARRAALGLSSETMTFQDAMGAMDGAKYESLLARVGSRRLPADEVLDAALRIDNLLGRADPETAGKMRAEDPAHFDASLAQAKSAAAALARACAAGESGEAQARVLLTSCLDCHRSYRAPR